MLILAIAAGLGFLKSQRLAVVQENYAKLAAEAATFGISLDPARPPRRERENKERVAKAVATELIAFAKEEKTSGKLDEAADAARSKRYAEVTARMASFDLAQVKILIAEMQASTDLTEKSRQGIINFSLTTLASKQPQVVLALINDSSDLLNKSTVSLSLAYWGMDDPMAALEWVRKNSQKVPGFVSDEVKQTLLVKVAADDPKLDLKLISELGIQDTSSLLRRIAFLAKTPENRMLTLAALRDYLVTLPDENSRHEATARSMSGFTTGLAQDGFTSATRWITGANFTPPELEGIAAPLSDSIKSEESGQWIEWISEKLPAEKSAAHVRKIVGKWTRADYQAAGKWLATTPASPTKNTAIRSYAETVSQYDPATATQWAMTLPPGPDREATLKHIQDHSLAK